MKRTALWIRSSLLGLFLLIASFYLLLATGFLGETVGKVTGMIVSDEITQISFRGLRTDIFWNTRADSVIVTDYSGLKIVICGTDIQGSLLDFLVNRHIDYILVERLDIDLPLEVADEDTVPILLSEILSNIDMGIATGTNGLILEYGRITDPFGVILDSMYLDAVIKRESAVTVDVNSARVELPGFGQILGNGPLKLIDGDVITEGFTGIAHPGSLLVSGTLSGSDETLDLEISGSIGTSSFDIPVDLSVLLEGSLKGKLSDPQVDLALSSGRAVLFGNEASFEVDTLTADLQNITVRKLCLATAAAELNFDGAIDIQSLRWNAEFRLNMSNTDISDYFRQISATDITGWVSSECSGIGSSDLNGTATIDLVASSSEIVDVSTLHIDAVLSDNSFNLVGSVNSGSGSISLKGNGYLGPGWTPESWTIQADGDIRNLSFLREFDIGEYPDIASAYFSLSGSGTPFGMNIQGNAGVSELEMDGIIAEHASFNGSLNFSTRNTIAGIPFGMNLDGNVEVLGFGAEGIAVDTASIEGTFNISGRSRTLDASLLIDSLRIISDVFHAAADIKLDGDDISIDGLTLTSCDERIYSAEIDVEMGDTTFFNVEEIRTSQSKLRVITAGGLSGFTTNGTIVLDTLWLDPPVGDLAMSGILSDEKTEMHADIVNFDLSSYSSFAGLPVNMSGIGNFRVSYLKDANGVQGSLTGHISDPAYGQFSMDSITVDITADDNALDINGIYAWHNGVRSGLQMEAKDIWAGTDTALLIDKIQWLELEVNDIGDWLFYILPLPVRTMGASVSARVEYEKYNGDYTFEMQASARISRLYITLLGIELPNVNFYLNYPDSTYSGYNVRFTLGAGSVSTGDFSSSWKADIASLIPFEIGDYSLISSLSEMEIAIPGMGAVICSGDLSTSGTGLDERPVLSGSLNILDGAVGIPQPVGSSSSGGSGELPFDLSIDVTGTGGLWFRTNFADIEMALKLRIFTLERMPTVNGYVSAVRGRITLLSRDFQITEGRVNIVQGNPPVMHLNVTAETTVRSIISHEQYALTVLISGDLENPEVILTGQGPSGQVSQEDILTLLAVGVTYSEMQQMNSSALRSEVENVAQTMLGSLIARNLRHEIGLDTFEISPELLSDTTSLVLNVGKYVLQNLYVSYQNDVFSADPGTVSAQYLFSSDLYVEGTSRSTIHGDLEPTLEIHYTIRY